MTSRVLKWTVAVDDLPHNVGSGAVVHVACQSDAYAVQVWTLEDERSEQTQRLARVVGTGQPIPDGSRHLGSAVTASGALVWHVFEANA